MISDNDTPFRLMVAAELVAMGVARDYYFFFRSRESIREHFRESAEATWLTATMGTLAILHFGAVFVYIARPSALASSMFAAAEPIRRIAIAISCAGAAGEIWGLISLGTSYNPLLRVGKQHALVTTGVYRWIRHPLYSFALPLMAGWGVATRNWFILASGILVTTLVMLVRAPREEAMMLNAFGQSYREYMARTGRFLPRLRGVRGKS